MRKIALALIFAASPFMAFAQSNVVGGNYHEPGYHTGGYYVQGYHDRARDAPSERPEAWRHDSEDAPSHEEESRLPSAGNILDR